MNEQEIRRAVFEKRPYLGEVYNVSGAQSILEYAKENLECSNRLHVSLDWIDARKKIIEITKDTVRPVLGESVSEELEKYLESTSYISTVDHHGPVTDPFCAQGNIIQALANKISGRSVALVFSAGGISLDNSTYPRGVSFHTQAGEESRLPIFSLRHQHQSVIGAGPYTKEQVRIFLIHLKERLPKLSLETLYGSESILALQNYWQQGTYANYHLFQKLKEFKDFHYIQIPVEIIASEILLRGHIQESSVAFKIIFDASFRETYLRETDGIPVAYTNKTGKGTELFWRLREGVREQLLVREGCLVNKEGDFVVPLNPEAVFLSLKNKEIFPSFALTLVLLSFWGGFLCGGGTGQVDYFSNLKDAYLRVLSQFGEKKEAEKIADMAANRLGSDYLFAYGASEQKFFPLTFLDIAEREEVFFEQLKIWGHTPLSAAIDNCLPSSFETLLGKAVSHSPAEKYILRK